MKLYLSDAKVDLVITLLKNHGQQYGAIAGQLLDEIAKAKGFKGKVPVVGAVNVTGEIKEFVEVTNVAPTSYLAAFLTKLTRFPALTPEGKLRLFVDSDAMLSSLRRSEAPFNVMESAKALPHFPAPNPLLLDNKNALGQTEDEFWTATDAMMDVA